MSVSATDPATHADVTPRTDRVASWHVACNDTRVMSKLISKGVFVGEWRTKSAPNGSVTTVERRVHTAEVYYSNGRKYARGHSQIQIKGSAPGPIFDAWDDGNTAAVDRWERRIAAEAA